MTGQKINFQRERDFEPAPREGRISCFWSEVPNVSVPISEAKLKYEDNHIICRECKACQD